MKTTTDPLPHRHVTPATLTLIPLIIVSATALGGFLIVSKLTSVERANCEELAEVFARADVEPSVLVPAHCP